MSLRQFSKHFIDFLQHHPLHVNRCLGLKIQNLCFKHLFHKSHFQPLRIHKLMFSSFSFHAETSPFWCDAFFTHTASIIQNFQANKCKNRLPENSSKFSLLFLFSSCLHAHVAFLCHYFLFSPSCVFFLTSIVEEKHFPTERARNKWKFFPSQWCRSFFFSFRSLRCRRINGRKLRKLCNIFIKFFAVACNFYEMKKFPCCVLLRMEPKKNGN